jgi:hypothetical protein
MTVQTSLLTSDEPSLSPPTRPEKARPRVRPNRRARASADTLASKETRYWVGVVSAEHVRRGVGGAFAQLCHGRAAPLKRMRPGDWLIYYSPAETRGGGEPVQAFTAIGRVMDGAAYARDVGGGFVPFRRDVAYLPCHPAPIRPLLASLSFLPDKARWGYVFRRGHLPIPEADFLLIARAMGVDPASAEPSADSREARDG